jgi:hypothetical protein
MATPVLVDRGQSRRRSIGRMVVLSGIFSFACADLATAQSPKLEISLNEGNAHPPVAVQLPRTGTIRSPITFGELSDTHDLWITGVDARLYLTKRVSAVGQVGWSNTPTFTYRYIQPALGGLGPVPSTSASDVAQTVERRVVTASYLQSFDFVAEGRVRPWVAAGLGLVHAVDQTHFVEVSSATGARTESTSETDRSAGAFLAAFGVRIYLSRRVFLRRRDLPWISRRYATRLVQPDVAGRNRRRLLTLGKNCCPPQLDRDDGIAVESDCCGGTS